MTFIHNFEYFSISSAIILTLQFFMLNAVSYSKHGWQSEPGNVLFKHSVPIKTLPFPTFRQILEALRG